MAIYEYFCPTCRTKFEERKPMSEATATTKCAQGHKAERTLSMFAVAGTGSTAVAEMDEMGGGGCCGGGGCACAGGSF
jgi:putative FmdB family regulatory protein